MAAARSPPLQHQKWEGGTACACIIRTTLGSGSSTMRRLGSWNRFHTWKRLTRAYLAMWWRAAMRLLLAAMARRRLRYRDVLDPEYFLDSPALLTSRDADHPWAECSRVQLRGRWACIGHPLGHLRGLRSPQALHQGRGLRPPDFPAGSVAAATPAAVSQSGLLRGLRRSRLRR